MSCLYNNAVRWKANPVAFPIRAQFTPILVNEGPSGGLHVVVDVYLGFL